MKRRPEPIVLAILDGWGVSTSWSGNAIAQAKPEHLARMWHEYPHAVLQAVAPADLALGGVGSSDTGHTSIGTGRLVPSDIADISTAIADRSFFQAPSIKALGERVGAEHSRLHLVGLTSGGTLHSHIDHLYGLLEAARQMGVDQVFVHAFTDGVDVPDGEARGVIQKVEQQLRAGGIGRLATVSGRSFAMDRSEQWQRTTQAFHALTGRQGRLAASTDELWSLVQAAHESDATITPTILTNQDGSPIGAIRPNDVVVFWNVRRDRTVQLVRAFADPHALAWLGLIRREPLAGAHVRTITDYHLDLPDVEPLFRGAQIQESLGRILADHALAHARVFSSDRVPHMTYYLNGGQAEPCAKEDRVVVPIGTRHPAGAPTDGIASITDHVTRLVRARRHSVIVVNYDAVDRVAHTGDVAATIRAIKAVDHAVGQLHSAITAVGGTFIVTADHGNAESMLPNRSGRRHTSYGVPVIVGVHDRRRVIRGSSRQLAVPTGLPDAHRSLADITPTVLALLGIAKPSAMTGRSLLP